MSDGTVSYAKEMTYKPEVINDAETYIYAFPTSGTVSIYTISASTGDITENRALSSLNIDPAGTFPSLAPSGNTLFFRAKNSADTVSYFCYVALNDTSSNAICYTHSVTSVKFTHALNDTIYFVTSTAPGNSNSANTMLRVQSFDISLNYTLNDNEVACSSGSCSSVTSHGVAFSGLRAVFGVELDGAVVLYDYTVDSTYSTFSGTRYQVNGITGTASVKAVYSRDNETYIIVDSIESSRGSSVIKFNLVSNAYSIYSLESGYTINDVVVNLTNSNLVLGGVVSTTGVMISTAADRYTYHAKIYDVGSGVNMTQITNSDYEMTSITQQAITPTSISVTTTTSAVSLNDFTTYINTTQDNQYINQWTSARTYAVTYASSESTVSPEYTCVSGSNLTEAVSIVQSGSNTLPSFVSWDSSSNTVKYNTSCSTATGEYIFDLQTMVNSDSTNLFTRTVTLNLTNTNL